MARTGQGDLERSERMKVLPESRFVGNGRLKCALRTGTARRSRIPLPKTLGDAVELSPGRTRNAALTDEIESGPSGIAAGARHHDSRGGLEMIDRERETGTRRQ